MKKVFIMQVFYNQVSYISKLSTLKTERILGSMSLYK